MKSFTKSLNKSMRVFQMAKCEFFLIIPLQLFRHHVSEFSQRPDIFKPPEMLNCIVGKEGIISGRYQHKKLSPKSALFITPKLEQHLFFSELLDMWLKVIVTKQVLKEIELARTFDRYILECKDAGMEDNLVNNLKRRLLLKLDQLSPQSKLLLKYKEFVVPRDQIEWVGLSLEQAITKQLSLDELNRVPREPLKQVFTRRFISNLKKEKSLQ
ncbi:39S ribosomal protein L28, mitochondrial [Cichlidogyrus casuarinus]|uniref:39S ribosomal protein L28, mitochondrial n=1 Tax=Cichlidogyrus casuarinus TaxID=1844966 RepID=A0ABD2PUU6_9PLAT